VSQEAINRTTRATQRARALGPDARCWHCGSTAQASLRLKRYNRKIWCYECLAAHQGKTTVEQHHLLGKANDPVTTVGVPGNLHRALSDAQHDWPNDVRYNTERDPLLWLAALCRSLRDIGHCVVGWLEQIAQFLEELSKTLKETHGVHWWEPLGVGPLWKG
jgi:hypothetical protein